MSAVRIVVPKLRLTAQLKAPGGVAVADALEAVQVNLLRLRPGCLADLQRLISEAEAAFANFPPSFQAEPLRALYEVAVRGVGVGAVCGAPAFDTALISLCDLLDHLLATGRWDSAAVKVHVRSLRLLISSNGDALDETLAAAVLDGLVRVSTHYAPSSAGL